MALLKKLGTFTSPSRRTFAALVTGLVAATGKRTVTGMLGAAGLSRAWSHDRVHAFFSRAAWNPETLGLAVSHLIVRALLPDGAALSVAVDGTLFKRWGKKVFGAGWQHDGAAKGSRPAGRGTCFVVLGLIVELPFLTRPVCLPVMARLWQPKAGPSKVELAASMLRLLAVCHRTRAVRVVAGAAYHGPALRHLPETISITTRLPTSAVLYHPAPPRTGRRGRPALKGPRLGTATQLAAITQFTAARVKRYGRTGTVHIAEIRCLWVWVLPHLAGARDPAARGWHGHRLRPGPGHHRPRCPRRSADHAVRLAMVHRGHLRRGPRPAGGRPGPQPHRERRAP